MLAGLFLTAERGGGCGRWVVGVAAVLKVNLSQLNKHLTPLRVHTPHPLQTRASLSGLMGAQTVASAMIFDAIAFPNKLNAY